MRQFRNMPIRWKLILAMMLTSIITVVLLGLALFLAGYLHLQKLAVQETAALAEIVGEHCAGMMAITNVTATLKALGNLDARTSVEDAFLYDRAGRLFASYTRRDLSPHPPPLVHIPGQSFEGDHLELHHTVLHDGVPVGTICLRANTQIIWARLRNYAEVGFIVMGLCIGVALIFARRLEEVISGPILELSRVARHVTDLKDFSLRATRLSDDEIGALTETFNHMLAIIQEQDSGSRVSQTRLEKRVAERTLELRKTSDALRESEERFRVVFEEAMDGFAVADVETKQLQLFNPRSCRMLGYSAGEMAGLSLADLHPAEEAPRILETFTKCVSMGIPLVPDVPVRRKDGSVFYADFAVSALTMNGRQCVLGICRDITERKQTREALQRQLEVETFVASVSSRLANTAPNEADTVVTDVLGGLGRLMRTDRCYLFRVSEDLATAHNTHEWCGPGVRSQLAEMRDVPTTLFSWYLERLRGGEPLLLRRRADLPAEAVAERRLSELDSTVSSALVPIRHSNRLIGLIGCETTRTERGWGDDDVRLLRTIGELITDTLTRAQSEKALRESEAKYSSLLQNMTDAFAVVDLMGRLQNFNQSFTAMLGYSDDELRHLTYRDFTPEKWHAFESHILQEQVIPTGSSAVYEKEYRRKDGLVFPVELRVFLIRDAAGRPAGLWAIIRDITERKRAEEMQRQIFQRLELATNAANLGLWEWDLTTGRGYASPIWKRQLGYAENEISSLHAEYENRLHPEDHDRVMEEDRRFLMSSATQLEKEFRMRHKDGSYRWILSRSQLRRDAQGKPLHIVGLHIDITDRKQAEQALRESEDQLRIVLDNSCDAIYRMNLQTGQYDFFSQAVTELTGYSIDELFAKGLSGVLNEVHPEDLPSVRSALEEARTTGTVNGHLEYRFKHKNGEYCWLSDRFTIVADANNRLLYWVGVSRDITQRKQAEQVIKALNESLEQRVAERTGALRQSEEQYRVLIETTNTGFVILDMEGRVVDANAEYVRLTGHSRLEEIRGLPVTTWTAPHDLGRNVVEVENCAQQGFIRNLEIDYVGPQGHITPIEINATVIGKGDDARILSLCRDITERKRAEEALFQNEEKFRRIATHIQDVLYSVDVEAQEFRYLSPAFEKMLGYTEEDIRTMGGRVAFLNQVVENQAMNPGDRVRRLERLKSQPKEGIAFRDEEWWRCKDGSLKCLADRWMPVYESGRLVSTEGSLSDITARKRAEDELRQSEKQFRAVFETASVGMAQTDPQTGRFLRMNQKMCSITGFSEDELLTRRVSDITHPDDRERDWAMFQRVVRGEAPSYRIEKRYVRKDGAVAWVSVNMTVIPDSSGQPARTLATIEDITERKRAEVALTESEQRYRSLVDNLNVGVYRNSPKFHGRFLQVNPALARMHGYDSVDEFLKTRITDHYDNPADRDVFLASLMKTGAVTNHEVRLKKKDGTTIFCAVTAKAHYGPDGQVDWIDGVIEDITERKRLERQLLEVSEREQRRIGQDLHDGLCQHLAGVGYMSKALARKLDGASRPEAEDARTLADLIRQAIADARATASGLYPVKVETNGIMAALQSLAANVESLFRIQCVFRCDPPVLLEDNDTAIHLYRIAQESVNNALRHGKAGHVTITLAEAGPQATLTVYDDGQGLPDPLPARRGIGLDIMQHRARMIRGTLDIRRAPEGGTILTCSFPLTHVV